MVAQPKRVLSTEPSEQDQLVLRNELKTINEDRFNGQLSIDARWAIPSAVEPRDPAEEIKLLSKADQKTVSDAMQAYAEREFAKAKKLLEPLCKYEVRTIVGLYTSIIRHLKEDIWFNTSQSIWVNDPDSLTPAAASTELKDNQEFILVHPALGSIGLKAPKYVLSYVLYHECLHKALNTSAFNPHPDIFRRLEKLDPNRERAVAWLRKNRFSTIEDRNI
tara:strand:+ start:18787 stop:19446 length:660 start_codon:yes stop_codon:yes gene_type:complete